MLYRIVFAFEPIMMSVRNVQKSDMRTCVCHFFAVPLHRNLKKDNPSESFWIFLPPSFLPSLSAKKWDLLGTYLGLTWDLLETHTPLRADGIVSVTLSWITLQRYCFFGTWQIVVPTLEQALSRMSGMRNRDSLQSYSSYSLQLGGMSMCKDKKIN